MVSSYSAVNWTRFSGNIEHSEQECCSFALNAEVDLFLSLKKGTAGSSGWQYVCSTKLSSGELICFNGGLSHNAGTVFS